uniref:Uncharacterized protein n=1 Tax=Oryza nivara TaxID=4536 RepID=A0A0E0IP01_ORYNI
MFSQNSTPGMHKNIHKSQQKKTSSLKMMFICCISCSLVPKIKKHALQFPVLCFRAGSLLMSTEPSLVYSEPTSCIRIQKSLSFQLKAAKSMCSLHMLISFGVNETGEFSKTKNSQCHTW